MGLSQPQLSRIVAKLEVQLGLTLLDRESRRKSSWTPAAHRLTEIYTKTQQSFRAEVNGLASGLTPKELRVGTLEGLVPTALEFSRSVLKDTDVMVVHLDVFDTSPLEEGFVKNALDLIFTAHDLGAKKYRYSRVLGYQTIDTLRGGDEEPPLKVHSMFEYAQLPHKSAPTEKAFVSNSLTVRQSWLQRFGGTGFIPTAPRAKRTGRKSEVVVMAVAHDSLPLAFWEEIQGFLKPSAE